MLVIDVTRLIDRTMQGRLSTGVDRVVLQYVEQYGSQSRALLRFAGRWLVFSAANSQRLFELLQRPQVKSFKAKIYALVGITYLFNQRAVLPSTATLFHLGHGGIETDQYRDTLSQLGWHSIFFVHDLIPITHAEYCRPGEATRHTARMINMLRLGSGLIFNSEATQNAMKLFAEKHQMVMPRSTVAWLAPGKLATPQLTPLISGAYFVILGTIEARKNHAFILQIWRRLVELHEQNAPKLLVIGQRGWECEAAIDQLERCEALREHVIEINHCRDDELATYLAHARALLFPSFAEGFGMPLVEAFSLGVPVICSDLSTFREIAGDIPEYIDPLDGLRWLECIQQYQSIQHPRRQRQLAQLRDYSVPSWDAHFQKVEALTVEVNVRVVDER